MPQSAPRDADVPPPADEVLAAPLGTEPCGPLPGGPIVRMPTRRRNQICIGIISVGLVNFLAFTLSYAALGGDAHNGHRQIEINPDGTRTATYYVRGHFIRSLSGREQAVSRSAWIYSYLHSITVPLTSGALIISMLVLARPHIVATMRGSWISGHTFVVAFGTVVILGTTAAALLLAWDFVVELHRS